MGGWVGEGVPERPFQGGAVVRLEVEASESRCAAVQAEPTKPADERFHLPAPHRSPHSTSPRPSPGLQPSCSSSGRSSRSGSRRWTSCLPGTCRGTSMWVLAVLPDVPEQRQHVPLVLPCVNPSCNVQPVGCRPSSAAALAPAACLQECEVEIGRLAHRITELREEASGLLAAAGSSSCPCPQATPAG